MDKLNAALAAEKCWDKLAVALTLDGQYARAGFARERAFEASDRATALMG